MVRVFIKQVLTFVAVATIALTVVPVASAEIEDQYSDPWYSVRDRNDWTVRSIGSVEMNATGVTGSGVKVAVLDSGIAENIAGLSNKVVAFKDFLPAQNPFPEHGTMTASTVAADYDPETGIRGVAPGAQLIIGRVCYLSSCDNEAISRAIPWAVSQGAKVISMSLAGGPDVKVRLAIQEAINQGVSVVSAMGNNGCSAYVNGKIYGGCNSARVLESYPAAQTIAGLIAVGASDINGARASFSNWGPNMDILAPGVGTPAWNPLAPSNGFGGTSAATPIVAGVVALLLQINPDFTPTEIQAILQSTATAATPENLKLWHECSWDSVAQKWVCDYLIPAPFSQHQFLGAGIVSAPRAVALAKDWKAGLLLDAPTLESSGLTITAEWSGGQADVLLNSKLVARSVLSPYVFEGNSMESYSLRIVRGNTSSKPNLKVLIPISAPPAPEIIRSFYSSGSIQLETRDITDPLRGIPMSSFNNTVAGIFTSDTGKKIHCAGRLAYGEEQNWSFECKTDFAPAGGTLQIMDTYSQLSPASNSVNLQNYSRNFLPLKVTPLWLSSNAIEFSWDEVVGARSYAYRVPEGDPNVPNFKCTSLSKAVIQGPTPQPYAMTVIAYDGTDCSGAGIATSDYVSYPRLYIEEKLQSSILFKGATSNCVYFEAEGLDSKLYQWRIYRSDGQEQRRQVGQDLAFCAQPNEIVAGKTFSYRFVPIYLATWIETWGELTSPISATYLTVDAPDLNCVLVGQRGQELSCDVGLAANTSGVRVELFDKQGRRLISRAVSYLDSRRQTFNIPGVVTIRATSFVMDFAVSNPGLSKVIEFNFAESPKQFLVYAK